MGDYTLKWDADKEVFSISCKQQVHPILETIPHTPFLFTQVASARVEESRGFFKIKESGEGYQWVHHLDQWQEDRVFDEET